MAVFAIFTCLFLTGLPSITGTKVCGPNEFWDTIESTCSRCTEQVCAAFKPHSPTECRCLCFPDHRECAWRNDWNYTTLEAKVDSIQRLFFVTSGVLTLFGIIFILSGVMLWRSRTARSRTKHQYKNYPNGRDQSNDVRQRAPIWTPMSVLAKAGRPFFKGEGSRSQKKTAFGKPHHTISRDIESIDPFIGSPAYGRGVQEESRVVV